MRSYQKVLATGTLITFISLSGCHSSQPKTLEGTVKEEFREGTEYGLIIESQGKTYSIRVRDRYDKPILALTEAIESGDKIKIIYDDMFTTIGEDGIGTTPSNSVSIIEKARK